MKNKKSNEEYYKEHNILGEIIEEDVEISLDEALKDSIRTGRRKRTMKNISIKIDPLYLQAIKKIATRKGIPYQTLLRSWLSEEIRKELKIA